MKFLLSNSFLFRRARLPISDAKVLITNVIHIQWMHGCGNILVRMPNIYLLLKKKRMLKGDDGKSENCSGSIFIYSFLGCCLVDLPFIPFVPWFCSVAVVQQMENWSNRMRWDEKQQIKYLTSSKERCELETEWEICPFFCVCVCNCFQYLFSNVLLHRLFRHLATVMMSVFSWCLFFVLNF